MSAQMITAIIIAALGPWIVGHGVLSGDQFNGFVNAAVTFALQYGVPTAMAVYAWAKTKRNSLIITTSTLPGVAHVAMDTQQGADEVGDTLIPDKVLSPVEVRKAVASQPGVQAVVMRSDEGARLSDHPKIVGPGEK